MKRLIILIVIFTLLMSGCNAKSNGKVDNQIKKPEITETSVESVHDGPIRIIIPDDKSRGFTPSDEHIDKWQKYMLDKYDLHIEVIYTDYTSRYLVNNEGETNGIDIADIKEIADQGGFIYVNNPTDIMELVDANLIMPVNDIISDIPEYAQYESMVFSTSATSDGKQWALPLYDDADPFANGRQYRKDWLSVYGKNVPKTPEEFLDYARYIAGSDLDGDRIDNSYITWYSLSSLTSDFADIFKAYGCYTTSDEYPIAWNPNTGQYELMAQSERFVELISFIKTLKDENYIKKVSYGERWDYDDDGNYKVASSLSRIPFNVLESEICFDLNEGSVDKMYTASFKMGFVVLQGTENVSGRMNTLINLLKSDEDAKMDLLHGIKDIDYFEEEDRYTVGKERNSKGTFERIGIGSSFSWQYDEKVVIWEGSSTTPEESKAIRLEADRYKAVMDRTVPLDMFYVKPLDVYSNAINQLNAKIQGDVFDLYDAIFTDNEDIETKITEFLTKMDEKGIFSSITEINASIK